MFSRTPNTITSINIHIADSNISHNYVGGNLTIYIEPQQAPIIPGPDKLINPVMTQLHTPLTPSTSANAQTPSHPHVSIQDNQETRPDDYFNTNEQAYDEQDNNMDNQDEPLLQLSPTSIQDQQFEPQAQESLQTPTLPKNPEENPPEYQPIQSSFTYPQTSPISPPAGSNKETIRFTFEDKKRIADNLEFAKQVVYHTLKLFPHLLTPNAIDYIATKQGLVPIEEPSTDVQQPEDPPMYPAGNTSQHDIQKSKGKHIKRHRPKSSPPKDRDEAQTSPEENSSDEDCYVEKVDFPPPKLLGPKSSNKRQKANKITPDGNAPSSSHSSISTNQILVPSARKPMVCLQRFPYKGGNKNYEIIVREIYERKRQQPDTSSDTSTANTEDKRGNRNIRIRTLTNIHFTIRLLA